jgi:GntR family transcriptional regulator
MINKTIEHHSASKIVATSYVRGSNVVPLYHRVYVILLQKLTDGSYALGSALPSEGELAVGFSVSRVTIRKAMERLEHEGRIIRQRGRGTFPLAQQPTTQEHENRFMRSQISLAQKTNITLLDYTVTKCPPPWHSKFGIEPDQNVLRITRIRFDGRSPISKTVCYLPQEFTAYLPRENISSLPISANLTEAGITLSHFKEHITAVLADSETAQQLEVDVGSALLMMTRWIEDESGRTVELLQALYRPDRYEYRVEYQGKDQKDGAEWKAMITDSHS